MHLYLYNADRAENQNLVSALSITINKILCQFFEFTQKTQHQEFIYKIDEFMEHHNDEVEDQDEQIMGILTYLTEWLVNHILYVDGQIPKG